MAFNRVKYQVNQLLTLKSNKTMEKFIQTLMAVVLTIATILLLGMAIFLYLEIWRIINA